ncbi:uridine kinase [Embleya sp. NPDC127516]|uniref:uridine kinase family protein n=1 Tax=Embleya sp. NPDC127516 TaxID=3363990 RepID=UPI0037F9FF1D
MARESTPVLALAGGAGSGKTTIARELARAIPGSVAVHLDLCYHCDPAIAPTVPAFDGTGPIVDFGNPRSIDIGRVDTEISRHHGAALVIVEGTFALALPRIRDIARWSAYVDAPADIRLARKTLRKIEAGKDPSTTLRGYLERGRAAHEHHVAPTRDLADLVLDGTRPVDTLVRHLLDLVAPDQLPGIERPARRACI